MAMIQLFPQKYADHSHIFTEQEFTTWAWRIPFVLGIFICFVGFYMRRNVPESPEYIAAQEIGETRDHPVVEVFKNHYKSLTAVVRICMLSREGNGASIVTSHGDSL